MSSNKCQFVFLLACCLLAAVAAASFSDPQQQLSESELLSRQARFSDPRLESSDSELLSRHARSPQHGSVVVTAGKDEAGRQAGFQYNHNLFTSSDGRGSIDAYANANRNFDYNRNDYGGGIQGRWRF